MLNYIKKNRKIIIEFTIIFLVSVIMCNGFIKLHYTTDTYKVANDGYKVYYTRYSLKDGRVFMFMAYYLCNMFKISVNIACPILTIIGMFFSCMSIVILKNILCSFFCEKLSTKKEIVLLILSFFSIFNIMYIDAIYFLDIFAISLSLLLFMKSIKVIFNEKEKYALLKSVFFSIIGTIAYQGTLNFFIAISLALIIIKSRKLERESIRKFLLVMLNAIIAVIINMIVVKILCYYLGTSQSRLNLNNIWSNFLYIVKNFYKVLIETCGFIRKYGFVAIIFTTFFTSIAYFYIKREHFSNNILRAILLLIIIIGADFSIFLATSSSFFAGRVHLVIGAIPCLMIIFWIVNSEVFDSKWKYVVYVFIGIIAIVCVVTYLLRISDVHKKNELEKEMCMKVLRYCEENQFELKEAMVIPIADSSKVYFDEIKTKSGVVVNEIRGYGSVVQGFNITTNSKLNEVSLTQEIYDIYSKEYLAGNKGIENTYIMYINGILVMPAFVW